MVNNDGMSRLTLRVPGPGSCTGPRGTEDPNRTEGYVGVERKGWAWLLSLGCLFLLGQHHQMLRRGLYSSLPREHLYLIIDDEGLILVLYEKSIFWKLRKGIVKHVLYDPKGSKFSGTSEIVIPACIIFPLTVFRSYS